MSAQTSGSGAGHPQLPRILAGKRRWHFARMIANGVAQAGATIALPFAIASQVGGLTATGVAILAGLALFLMAAKAQEFIDAERLGLHYVQQVRLSLLDGLLTGTSTSRHGVAMTRLMNDLTALKSWVGLGFARSMVAGLALAGCVTAAAMISWHHMLVLLGPLVAVAVVAAILVGPFRTRVGEVRRRRGRLAARVGETLLAGETVRAFGRAGSSRQRIRKAGASLYESQVHSMKLGGLFRALPETVLPATVVVAVASGLPLQSDAISVALLAGLAIDPVRKALRAVEYRAAFVVARTRIRPGLGKTKARNRPPEEADTAEEAALDTDGEPKAQAEGAAPVGLTVLRGPRDQVRQKVPADALSVSSEIALLPGSLRRNIDVTRQWRGKDDAIASIASHCRLDCPDLAPKGLNTRFRDRDPRLTPAVSARLSLARALAAGARAVCVDAPVLLTDREGSAILRSIAKTYPVALYVMAGDADPGWADLEPDMSGALAA